MKKIYRITEKDDTQKFYRLLTNLCKDYDLSYTKVYHKLGRRKEPYIGEFLKIEIIIIED